MITLYCNKEEPLIAAMRKAVFLLNGLYKSNLLGKPTFVEILEVNRHDEPKLSAA
jgi:hypothetical protein